MMTLRTTCFLSISLGAPRECGAGGGPGVCADPPALAAKVLSISCEDIQLTLDLGPARSPPILQAN